MNKYQIQIDILEEVLKEDFDTNDKKSVPFSDEILLVRKRIQDRINKLKALKSKSLIRE